MTLSFRRAFARVARGRIAFVLVVFALGSALGAAVCALTFARLVALRPLPYPDQDRLFVVEQVILDRAGSANSRALSYPAIALLHDGTQGVVAVSAMIDRARDVVTSHPANPLVSVSYVTPGYAELFAPPMAMGRFRGTADDAGRRDPVAVISHSAWQSLFDGRPDVLGRSVRTAAGIDFEVVGVTAQRFVEPRFGGPDHRTDVWLPWDFDPAPAHWGWAATTDTLTLVGRLMPGVNEQQAAERLSTLLNSRWREELGASSGPRAGWSTRVEFVQAQRAIAGDVVGVGLLLFAGTLGLLLVTLANVIHVLVAQVAERSRDFAIQLALGATRNHLYGAMLGDMLALMLPVGVVAMLVAAAGLELMQRYLGSLLPRLQEASPGWESVAVTIGAALALALLLAAVALRSTGRGSAIAGIDAGRHGTAPKVSRRLRAVLMASQVGIAGLLIAASHGLFREAYRVLDEPRIDLDHSTSAFLYRSLSAPRDEAWLRQQLGEIRRRLAGLPGVRKLSQSHSPLQQFIDTIVATDRSGTQYPVELKRIDHEYFEITGQALTRGRNFSAADIQGAADVAIVNAAFAKVLQRDGEVLGRGVSRDGETTRTVVGVVQELAYPGALTDKPRIYEPASEAGSNFIITFEPGSRMTRQELVAFIASVNPDFGVFLYDDLSEQRSDILLPRRITAISTLVVALVVSLVSGLGLYGMVSYATRLSRVEIGTRMAFGARPRHIVRLLVGGIVAALVSGGIASVAAALLLLHGLRTRFGEHLLDLRWMDAAVAFGSLVLLALLACWLSARPLLSQPPSAALREAGR